jgi:hypothetical protein
MLIKMILQCRDKNMPVSETILLEKTNENQSGHTHF